MWSSNRGFNSASDMRALRRQAGLTQARLGELAGYSRQSVYYYEGQSGSISGPVPAKFRAVIEGLGLKVPGYGETPLRIERDNPKRTHCGARTRRGTECQCRPLASGRCKFHGGMSTGPKSDAGRQRIAEAQRERHRKARAAKKIRAMVENQRLAPPPPVRRLPSGMPPIPPRQ